MPKFEITSPEGKRFEIEAPDGATPDQALAYFKQNYKPGPDDFDKRVMAAGGTTGNFGQDFLAGAGKAVSDLYQGGKQLVGMGDQARVDEARKLDAPLMNTNAK